MQDIEKEAEKKGFQLAWNLELPFVIHGHRTLFQNKGGSAVQRVEVALTEEEEVGTVHMRPLPVAPFPPLF